MAIESLVDEPGLDVLNGTGEHLVDVLLHTA